MRIAIDIRSLIEPFPSGISEYTKRIIANLLEIDKENQYLLFYNSARSYPIDKFAFFNKENVKFVIKRWPNKLFNASLFFLNHPKLDRLIGDVDLYFLPNPNFISISRRSKLLVTAHDISFNYPSFYSSKGYLWHRFIRPRKIFKQADRIIAVSASTGNDICRRFELDNKKVDIIPLGVDHDKMNEVDKNKKEKVKNQYQLSHSFFLFLGNVEKRKNIDGLLQAWQIFRKKPNSMAYELIIAGRIIDHKLVRKLPGVKYLGYIEDEDKPYLYHLAAGFVYPSFYEGFGLPVLEAMTCGLPVITSFSTSLPEISKNSALLINPYNAGAIARAMEIITENRKVHDHYSLQAKKLAQDFSWRKTAQKTLQIFKSLAEKNENWH